MKTSVKKVAASLTDTESTTRLSVKEGVKPENKVEASNETSVNETAAETFETNIPAKRVKSVLKQTRPRLGTGSSSGTRRTAFVTKSRRLFLGDIQSLIDHRISKYDLH